MCEAISVIVPRTVLARSYARGVAGYEADCSNGTYCSDAYLTRVGFMNPDDVRQFADGLVAAGLRLLDEDQRFVDLAIVDERTGPTATVAWLEVKRENGVTEAWLAGERKGEMAAPVWWSPGTMHFVEEGPLGTEVHLPEGKTIRQGEALTLYHARTFSPDSHSPPNPAPPGLPFEGVADEEGGTPSEPDGL